MRSARPDNPWAVPEGEIAVSHREAAGGFPGKTAFHQSVMPSLMMFILL